VITRKLRLRLMQHASLPALFALERAALIDRFMQPLEEPKQRLRPFASRHKEKKLNG
jgi:hypothetical protein